MLQPYSITTNKRADNIIEMKQTHNIQVYARLFPNCPPSSILAECCGNRLMINGVLLQRVHLVWGVNDSIFPAEVAQSLKEYVYIFSLNSSSTISIYLFIHT